MNKKYKIVRNEILNEKVVFVDGLPGNGKTLFSWIIQELKKNISGMSLTDIERYQMFGRKQMGNG